MKTIYFGGDTSYKQFIIKSFKSFMDVEEVNKLSNADIIYWVYGKGPSLIEYPLVWLFNKQFLIVHWIGSDVLYHTNKFISKKIKSIIFNGIWNKLIIRKSRKGNMLNLVCAEWLKEELAKTGIECKYLPITSLGTMISDQIDIKKRNYDFLSYVPKNRFEFYGGKIIWDLAASMPEKSFLVIIPDIINTSEFSFSEIPSNLKILPRLDFNNMKNIYQNCKTFLRLTMNDGLSLSVLEAMSMGMHVIWSFKFPHTLYAYPLKKESIQQIIVENYDDWNVPNIQGRNFVLENFNDEAIGYQFEKIIKSITI